VCSTAPSAHRPTSRTLELRSRASRRSTTSAACSPTSPKRLRAIPASAADALSFNTGYAATVAAHDTNGSGNLDSTAEIDAALADPGPGGATDQGVVKLFECPVIPAH
jgi:hypothetical protein